MAPETGKKQVCCACDFPAGIKAQLRRKADATAARLRASQRACTTTSPPLSMALKIGIQKNRCVGAPPHVPLLYTYQKFVEQQEDFDPQVDNGRIMGSALLDGAKDRQKAGVFCFSVVCRYRDFVEQHQDTDPQVDNGRIMGSASLDCAEDRQKTGVLCIPLFCRPLGVVLKSSTCANNQACCDHLTASSHGDKDGHSTKTSVWAPRHSVCRMQVTSLNFAYKYRVRRSAEGCNSLLRFCTLSRGRSLFSLRER